MTKEITLTKGLFTLVDDSDYESLSVFNWCVSASGYAVRRKPGSKTDLIWMHREILPCSSDYEVDHINHNRLDNRRVNLRLSTHAENDRNSKIKPNNGSGYKGVSKCRSSWRSYINTGKKQYHLGVYESPIDAAVSYDVAALRMFGEFAFTNFPRENYVEMRSWE